MAETKDALSKVAPPTKGSYGVGTPARATDSNKKVTDADCHDAGEPYSAMLKKCRDKGADKSSSKDEGETPLSF